MNLDIRSAVQIALVISILGAIFSIWMGIRAITRARKLRFFRMRRDQNLRGWRLLLAGLGFVVLSAILIGPFEPFVYRFFPPTVTPTSTPTVTLTPTITQTPTITLTPSITPTKSVTDTPTVTPTPFIPLAIELRFESTTTPNPEARFSTLTFSDGLDEEYRPLKPGTVFQNPVDHLYAIFSYDNMVVGSQWTALWYRQGELVHYESIPWNGTTGGLGYTDWNPDPDETLPGLYEVQIFVGLTFKVSGTFEIQGTPPTAPPTETPTHTPTSSPTATATRTPYPTATPVPTRTPRPTLTPTLSPTPTRTRPPYQSPTPTSTRTPWPTATPITPTVTWTPWPTATPRP